MPSSSNSGSKIIRALISRIGTRKKYCADFKKMLVDEIMTFEINGKPQNFLRLASKQTQNEVAKYVAAVNKCLNYNTK